MKNGIPDKTYYELLDWKDKNLEEFRDMFGNQRLCDFSVYELINLDLAIKSTKK